MNADVKLSYLSMYGQWDLQVEEMKVEGHDLKHWKNFSNARQIQLFNEILRSYL